MRAVLCDCVLGVCVWWWWWLCCMRLVLVPIIAGVLPCKLDEAGPDLTSPSRYPEVATRHPVSVC